MSFTIPIVMGILFCITAGIFCSRLSEKARHAILSALALFFVCSEIAKQILLYHQNSRYIWWYFPFQLCSMHLYLLPVVAMLRYRLCLLKSACMLSDTKLSFCNSMTAMNFSTLRHIKCGNTPIFQKLHLLFCTFLADFGTLAGIFAFADTTGMHHAMPILTVHSYLWHFLMIFTGILLGLENHNDPLFTSLLPVKKPEDTNPTCSDYRNFCKNEIKFNKENFFPACVLFLVFASIAELFNCLFHTYGEINLFYISLWEPVTQAVFRDIAVIIGDMMCHVLYLAMIMTGAGVVHLVFAKLQSYFNP